MENSHEVLAIIVIVVIFIIVVFVARKTVFGGNDTLAKGSTELVTSEEHEDHIQEREIAIYFERLPATTEIDDINLFEIEDRTIIARISQSIPTAAEIAAKTITNNVLKSVELYKVIIPSGVSLTKSKQMTGAQRGFFRGAKGVRGHANLVKVDPKKISKATTIANGVANVINVGSLVVGQYYMSEINSKLEILNSNISKIVDFQDHEFKSRIMSLLSRVGEISKFNLEIMEIDEYRKIKLMTLESLKGIDTELLGQVNLTINEIVRKNTSQNYQNYQKIVDELNILVEYQRVLLIVLEEISKLIQLLGLKDMSSDMSYSLFNKYLDLSIQTRNSLVQWHDRQAISLRIDLDKDRISKSGVEGFLSVIPGLVDDKWKYKDLKQGLNQKISSQKSPKLKITNASDEVYSQDVEIIIKDGKYYFLHEASDKDL